MHKHDSDRVVFYSVQDLSSGRHLTKCESILKREESENPQDINDILELYNIKLYIDSGSELKSWSPDQIDLFKEKVVVYGKLIGKFVSTIDDSNFISHHQVLLQEYLESFWRVLSNQKSFDKISENQIQKVLSDEPHQIMVILKNKRVVERYGNTIRDFLVAYPRSAEIILSIYETDNDFFKSKLHLPELLTVIDKENIISNYIDWNDCNVNYLPIIQNAKRHSDFSISDKTKLKAKRRRETENENFFKGNSDASLFKYGVSVSYSEDISVIKEYSTEESITHCTYSLNYIKRSSDPYLLYLNFKILFEYVDQQGRISLFSKPSALSAFEKLMGVRSKNDYRCGVSYNFLEMMSQAQIHSYSRILQTLDSPLEKVLQYVYNTVFAKKYGYADNAILIMPTESSSALEKVRSIAPELESILKQYRLFVENNEIDFELLQISSAPSSIKDIPSLSNNKNIYINKENSDAVYASFLFFSDQTILAYVEPFKDSNYQTLFELLVNEDLVSYDNYEEFQTEKIDYLINQKYLIIDERGFIRFFNEIRVNILRDLYENETASFYHYPALGQDEVQKMFSDRLVYFDDSLFSKPEQDYFNFHLNKSEFTNGLDLRNSYLHGTQVRAAETAHHENSYLIYLKLVTLTLLKIEDDLLIHKECSVSVQTTTTVN